MVHRQRPSGRSGNVVVGSTWNHPAFSRSIEIFADWDLIENSQEVKNDAMFHRWLPNIHRKSPAVVFERNGHPEEHPEIIGVFGPVRQLICHFTPAGFLKVPFLSQCMPEKDQITQSYAALRPGDDVFLVSPLPLPLRQRLPEPPGAWEWCADGFWALAF